MKRVLLDTNVLLTGAIWRGSCADALAGYREKLAFSAPTYCITEAEQLVAARTLPETAVVIIDLLHAFLLRLGCVLVATLDANAVPRLRMPASDQPIYQIAIGQGVDYLCTYNVKDFPEGGPEVRSPLGILRDVCDPAKYLIQWPVLGTEGTLMVATRQYGDDRIGLLLETAGLRILQPTRDKVVVEGADVHTWNPTGHAVPEGYAYVLVVRYQSSGAFEISAWSRDAPFPPEVPVGSGGKLVLGTGVATLRQPVVAGFSLGLPKGFRGGCSFAGGIPRYVHDRTLRQQALRDESLEGVDESRSLEELLGMCRPFSDPDGTSGIEVVGAFSRRLR